MKGVSGSISSELVPEACQCHLPLGGYSRYVHQITEHWQIQKDKLGYRFNCYKEIELIDPSTHHNHSYFIIYRVRQKFLKTLKNSSKELKRI